MAKPHYNTELNQWVIYLGRKEDGKPLLAYLKTEAEAQYLGSRYAMLSAEEMMLKAAEQLSEIQTEHLDRQTRKYLDKLTGAEREKDIPQNKESKLTVAEQSPTPELSIQELQQVGLFFPVKGGRWGVILPRNPTEPRKARSPEKLYSYLSSPDKRFLADQMQQLRFEQLLPT